MKGIIKVLLICILIGIISAFLIIKEYKIETTDTVVKSSNEVVYMLQIGAYEKESNVTKVTKNLPFYYVSKEGELYHIYVGIVKNQENLDYIKEFYKVFGNNIYVREKTISNSEYVDLLNKYETVIMNSIESNIVFSIQKELLSKIDKYEGE